jgi:hypothetical protein
MAGAPVPKPPEEKPRLDIGHVPMSEEMDRAKWTLPPIVPLLIAAAIVAILLFVYTSHTSKPLAKGQILGAYAVQEGDQQQVLVAVQLSLSNTSSKPFWIKAITVQLKPAGDPANKPPLEDEAASRADFDRYFQAFPDLAAHRMEPIGNDSKLSPGETAQGMVIVGFPVSKDTFDKRQWLRVMVTPYNHEALTIK